jgi:tRNA (guanosine-2'-O-)-methyltransferase
VVCTTTANTPAAAEGRRRPYEVSQETPAGRAIRVRSRRDLRTARRRRAHRCWDHLIAAPLWPLHGVNLGTLLRTCDAVGACLVVPRGRRWDAPLARGDTLRHRSCVHRAAEPLRWLAHQRGLGIRVLAVELAEGAIRLGDLPAARERTIVLLGHERDGVPDEAVAMADQVVEIPMIGTGLSLNVAVAGSLVAYRLAGML